MNTRISTMIHLDETDDFSGKVVSGDDSANGKPYAVLSLGYDVAVFIKSPSQIRDLVNTLTNMGMALDEEITLTEVKEMARQ